MDDSDRLETVKILGGPKGTRIINKADFDPKMHKLAGKKPTKKGAK